MKINHLKNLLDTFAQQVRNHFSVIAKTTVQRGFSQPEKFKFAGVMPMHKERPYQTKKIEDLPKMYQSLVKC